MAIGHKEKRFLDALEALFIGAEVEGDSGFVNLMRIKRQYFESIQPMLMAAIDRRAAPETSFREELFDKLWTFFRRYFSESGSIYFRHLPAFAKTYERVYADDKDVALAWKTQMLYYVKSDVLVRSMPVKLPERDHLGDIRRFYFDATEIEHKRNNEKREFVFAFDKVDDADGWPVLHLKVSYSEKGKKTKSDDIIRQARKSRLRLSEDELEKAFRVFRGQTEVDFFINKDARGFLREQFDLWLYQFMFREESIFEAERVKQLQAIQKTAYDVIDFIAQFEDELRRAWEKPKFVRGVHYVVTLDKLPAKLLKKITEHKGIKAQTKEWRQLGMVENGFNLSPSGKGAGAKEKWQHLPLDTRHFKDLELEILDALGNLDEALDGELVHSENWQALNTLQRRYRGKVKCIYIDPPYNTDASEIAYKNGYKNSSWITLLENRIVHSASTLMTEGVFIAAIDDTEMVLLSHLLEICLPMWERNMVVVNHHPAGAGLEGTNISCTHEYAIFMTPPDVKILRGEKKDIGQTERGFVRTGTAESNLRIGRPNSFYAILVNPKNFKVMGAEEPPQGADYPEENTSEGWIRIYPIGTDGTERVWRRSYKSFLNENKKGNIICKNGMSIYQLIEETDRRRPIFSNWTDKKYNAGVHGSNLLTAIMGKAGTFSYPKSIYNVEDCIKSCVHEDKEVVLDFFAGSGTTAHAVINLNREDGGNRKYLLVEMGDYFHTVLLPRIKKVVYSKDWKDGQPVSREGSSHCLKYYTLEQYEETLKNSHYKDGEQIEIDSLKSPFEQYVFFNDDKLAHAVQVVNKERLEINLHDLYPDLDIAESFSNALGKPIRRRTADQVTFADGTTEKTNPAKMTAEEKQHFITLLKPYLWWGE